jgi:uncharacterized membrane protein YebE (DUF533 family)
MLDAKSLLEMLMRGAGGNAGPGRGQAQGGGGLGDILGQLGAALGQPAGQGTARGQPQEGGGGLGDILGQLGAAFGDSGARGGRGAPQSEGGQGGGGLADILGHLQQQLGAGAGGKGGGGLMDILGQVLGQATQGVKEGAQRIDAETGASGHMRDALGRATGQSPEEIMAQLKDLVSKNQLGTAVAAGGLGAVLLGTKTGRAVTGSALTLGGLALIGGLAYKAIQSYQQGKTPEAGARQLALAPPPSGSGFEPEAMANETAMALIRAMIAAASSDGRVDAEEQKRIMGGLQGIGVDREAEEFLAAELNNPASIDDLIASVGSEQDAVQLYTAARLAVDADTAEESQFLSDLANGLGLDAELVAHIDATARAAA